MGIGVTKIVSGGQTGADRGGLDAAIDLGIPHGGKCPKGRLAEDGTIPDRYKLRESPSSEYDVRTEDNVRRSDGTLICTFGRLTGGSRTTAEFARKHNKPFLHLDLNAIATDLAVEDVQQWLNENRVRTLNVAGTQASGSPGLYGAVKDLLLRVLA